ncbi:MAG: hypothetical protein K2X81_07260, partial [Candidatus Obscuribacterales bacterium]|nr:hypothetical protein [Candidatus Obscuribacterales bacterium]
MPQRKQLARTASNPTIEQMQVCICMLQDMRPKFQEMQQQPEIDYADLDSLTNRFKTTVIEMYGHNSQLSERYEQWKAYWLSSWNQRDSQQKRHEQIQQDYRDGLDKTLKELNSVIDQLELKLKHSGAAPKLAPSTEIRLILQLCSRLNHSAKILNRRRAGKQSFEITDEYDVQDLLQAVLRAYFKYSISEEPISKLSGSSSRADFAIQDLGVIIEAKYVHGPNEQDRI